MELEALDSLPAAAEVAVEVEAGAMPVAESAAAVVPIMRCWGQSLYELAVAEARIGTSLEVEVGTVTSTKAAVAVAWKIASSEATTARTSPCCCC